MVNFFDEIKQYIQQTSYDVLLKDWAETAEFNDIGISATNYMMYLNTDNLYPELSYIQSIQIENKFKPESDFGFFNNLKINSNAESSIFDTKIFI